MQIQINILNVTITNPPGKKYKKAEVDYKDLNKGTAASRSIMSFGSSERAFATLAQWKPGDTRTYTLELVKEGEYWNWISLTPAGESAPAGAAQQGGAVLGGAQPAKNFVAKDDERQALIVRQSSAKAAIDLLTLQGNKKATIDDVVALATQVEDYVFGRYQPQVVDTVVDKTKSKSAEPDFDDDIKF